MDQSTFQHIIQSDQPIAMSAEMMAAAEVRAHQLRSKFFLQSAQRARERIAFAYGRRLSARAFLRNAIAVVVAASALSTITPAQAEVPIAEIVAQFDQRPGAVSSTPDGRLFMSIHPLIHPVRKMVEISPNGHVSTYPNEAFSEGDASTLKAVLAIRTDDQGIAWILDFGGNAIYAWDTNAEALIKTIPIPEEVRVPTSFMQDFALDQKRGRAIIADMTQGDLKSAPTPAFVTVDLDTGEAKRIAQSHPSMMPESEGGFALNPITIDPDYEWVYFGALNGHTMYRVSAASFDGPADKVAEQIEVYGPKPFSDGSTIDGEGNVYINDIENNAIGVTTAGEYQIIATLPEGQSWPDGNAFGSDGYIYVTVNQLAGAPALNEGQELGKPPYLLVRTKALAGGNTGR